MPFSNYSQLKTGIASWLHRSDLTALIPDFITLAESRINRLASVRSAEFDAALVMTIGSRYIALPTNHSSPMGCWLETYQPRQELTPLVPERMPVASNVSGPPSYWCIDGVNLAFDIPADRAHTITFRYNARYQLTDAAPTNQLLTDYPDLYLYASLLEAAPYIRDDKQLAIWEDRYDRALREISNDENRSRSIGVLTTDTNMSAGRRFNIFRGN